MWRWIIRIYVSLMVFLVLLFLSFVFLKEAGHLLAVAGSPWLSRWYRSHVLLTAFFTGIMAGQVSVGSGLTGEGWFRSKDGKTFEGFKLEELRPSTWLMVSLVFLLGVFLWGLDQAQFGVPFGRTLTNFYHEVLMSNCSDVWASKYWFNESCNTQILFVASWVASIGYSMGPIARRLEARVLISPQNKSESRVPVEESQDRSMKEKTEMQ